MKWHAQAVSDIGLQRPRNEDAFHCRPERGAFAVADGMGGRPGGEIASDLAIEIISSAAPNIHDLASLGSAIEAANAAVHNTALVNPALAEMGTTLSCLLLSGGHALVGHVGDSRIYLMRDGELQLITRDHTVAQRKVDEGVLRPEDADRDPSAHALTRSIGGNASVSVDLREIALRSDDTWLLCTDGLPKMLDDREIGSILRSEAESARALVEEANRRGGIDNVTVIVVRSIAN